MSEGVHQEYDVIRFGDPVVLLFRTLFVVASAALIWDAAGVIPRLLTPHVVRPGDEFTSPEAGSVLFISGWIVVTALTIVVTRRRRRSSGA